MLLDGKSVLIALADMPFATASLSLLHSSGVHLGAAFPRIWWGKFACTTLIGCDKSAVSGDSNFGGGGEVSSVLLYRVDVEMPLRTTKDG